MHFADFVRQYQDMVYTTAIRITGNARDAQDISQEVFVKAFEQFESMLNHENPGGWLRTTTRNLSINTVVRYQKRFQFPWEKSGSESMEGEPVDCRDDTSWLFDTSDMLKRALLKLSHAQRAALVLHYYEGFEYQEIAKKLGISLSKVKTDILRGKREMQKYLNKWGDR